MIQGVKKMIKKSNWFKPLFGSVKLSGRCGDVFVVDGRTLTVVGWTNSGENHLVNYEGTVYKYVVGKG